jgi:hypothetical protein
MRNTEHFQQGRITENRTLTLYMDGRVRFPAGTRDFSLFHDVQTGSRALSVSYPMNVGDTFPGSKAAGA